MPQLAATDEDPLREAYKRTQLEFFDDEDAAFETTRPVGAPRFHGWLLEEKLRRVTTATSGLLDGAVVVTVCGGSGMDAELLARRGARVVVSDLSPGAASRARERARRTGLPITSIVADAEHIPLADASVDVAFVHDGLHHLADPMLGVDELARVASRVVLITEPARAAVTGVAVRLGLALEVEDAGNRVERLDPGEVARRLEGHGFAVKRAARYGMYYLHHPGRVARFASRSRVFPLATGALRTLNAVGGGVGNKLAVQAVKEP